MIPLSQAHRLGGGQSEKSQLTVVRAATESTLRAPATPGGQTAALRRDYERDLMGQKEPVGGGGGWVGSRGKFGGKGSVRTGRSKRELEMGRASLQDVADQANTQGSFPGQGGALGSFSGRAPFRGSPSKSDVVPRQVGGQGTHLVTVLHLQHRSASPHLDHEKGSD